MLQDDFSAPSSTWPAGASNGGFTSFSSGTYLVGVDPESSISALTNLDPVERDVRLEATVVRMPSAGSVLVGLACRADETDRFYELAISGAGRWVIVRRPDLTVLGSGTFDPSTLGSGPVDLEAECSGGDAESPLRLALSVNGRVVGVDVGAVLSGGLPRHRAVPRFLRCDSERRWCSASRCASRRAGID